jgi:lysyl-tRNA synthetase class 1
VEYDGEGVIRYICHGTNQTDEVDFRETHNAKLAWKIDWPMRWAAEGVNFEPGGHDHATPGGSYDTSFEIAKNIFGRLGPVFVGYEFIGLRGMSGKMSGSKGGAVSPSDLLQIYTPELLKWLYLRRLPTQKFELAFDASVFRDYTEMDRMVGDYDKLREGEKRIIAQSLGHAPTQVNREAVPFQTAVSVGQIVHWNRAQFEHALGRINQKASTTSIDQRLPRARHWLEAYNPDQAVSLLPSPNIDYIKHLTPEQREQICDLVAILQNEGVASIDALQQTLYAIPKSLHFSDEQNRQRQRTFFVALYQLLIGKDTGPRLATFIAAADDLKKILALLSLEG